MDIEIRGMAPLIQVLDMPTSLAFYRDVLGFEVADTSPARGPNDFDWARLRQGDTELMLNTAYEHERRPPQPEAARVQGHADITFFFECPNLDEAYTYLEAMGVELAPPAVAYYGMRQLHFRDPDGYGICLQWRVA